MSLRISLLALAVSLLAATASAQPEVWDAYTDPFNMLDNGVRFMGWLGANDFGRFPAPRGTCMGPVSLSADRRSFFVPTSLGLARFDTNRRTFVEFLPDVVNCNQRVIEPPSGLRWYVVKASHAQTERRLRLIDAVSRTVIIDEPSTIVDLAFGPDGRRYEIHEITANPLQLEVRAFASETASTPLWQHALDSGASASRIVASSHAVFVLVHDVHVLDSGSVVRLDGASGNESGRVRTIDKFGVDLGIQGLSLTASRLYVAGPHPTQSAFRASLDIETLDSPVLVAGTPSTLPLDVADIITGADAAAGYVIQSLCSGHSPLSCDSNLVVVDLATLAAKSTHPFGASFNTAAWTLGQIAEPRQPRISRLSTEGRRISVSWEPSAAGALPNRFVLRGRPKGASDSFTLATLEATERSWTSPTVPPGEYTLQIVAANSVGESAPVSVDVGIETSGAPQAPQGLAAFTAGRSTARLTWAPPAAGPLPTAYSVEAAAPGGVFVPALTTTLPELALNGIPTGTWQVRVRAITSAGAGPASEVVELASATCVSTTDGVESVAASVDGAHVVLQWSAPASGPPLSYRLVVSSDGEGSNVIASLPVSGTTTSLELDAPSGVFVVRVVAESPCATAIPSRPAVIRVP